VGGVHAISLPHISNDMCREPSSFSGSGDDISTQTERGFMSDDNVSDGAREKACTELLVTSVEIYISPTARPAAPPRKNAFNPLSVPT
jgi:hypothetical protein